MKTILSIVLILYLLVAAIFFGVTNYKSIRKKIKWYLLPKDLREELMHINEEILNNYDPDKTTKWMEDLFKKLK